MGSPSRLGPDPLGPWRSAAGKVLRTKSPSWALMIPIIVLFTVLMVMAAKRKGYSRRRGARLVVLKFDVQISMGTLADNAALLTSIISSFTTAFWCSSADVYWSVDGHTTPEGPLVVGLCHGAYTAAQVVEALDASPTGPDDVIAIEQGRRMVRRSGQFAGNLDPEVLNDGKAIRTKCRWTTGIAEDFELFVVNRHGAPLTTGGQLHARGQLYGNWK